jgi:histidine ammonia-lyase
VDALTRVLAVELLTAARGIELRAPLQPSAATGAVISAIRTVTQGPGIDRFMAPEIEAAVELVAGGDVLRAVQTVTGPLR